MSSAIILSYAYKFYRPASQCEIYARTCIDLILRIGLMCRASDRADKSDRWLTMIGQAEDSGDQIGESP